MNETIASSETVLELVIEPTSLPTESLDPTEPLETIQETSQNLTPTVAENTDIIPDTTQETFLEFDLDAIQETEATEATQETVAILVEVQDLEQYVFDLAHVQLYCSFLLAGVMAAVALFLRWCR